MVTPKALYNALRGEKIDFFSGVPDSLLKDFLAYVEKETEKKSHVIAANEGNAIAIATGYHLATGEVPAVYMQNSGLGNAVNPLISLTHRGVYGIPILLIVGWRGEPGIHDEPQHEEQGRITEELLKLLGISYKILTPETREEELSSIVREVGACARETKNPCALLVRKGVFEVYKHEQVQNSYFLKREDAIRLFLESLEDGDIVVSATGKISREVYELREKMGRSHEKDFLTVGSMGHVSQIALGLAMQKPGRDVYCLDGDGSFIMHMGASATVGWVAQSNLKHIVLNNLAHESVGGQPSAAQSIDIPGVAKSCGYMHVESVDTGEALTKELRVLRKRRGPALLEVKVNLQSRDDLIRPKEKPIENKEKFMRFVREG